MTSKTGASFARGTSKQDYSTPSEFVAAVKRHFGIRAFSFDLAASSKNSKAERFFGERTDALKQDWIRLSGHLWLNPPYGDIAPWAEKCAFSRGSRRTIYFLVPASVGAKWFAEHVHRKACVYFLCGRLSFDGKHPYPKDCILAVYGAKPGYVVWDWKKDSCG